MLPNPSEFRSDIWDLMISVISGDLVIMMI